MSETEDLFREIAAEAQWAARWLTAAIVERAVSGGADDMQSLVPVLRVVERVTGWADAVADMTAATGDDNRREAHE